MKTYLLTLKVPKIFSQVLTWENYVLIMHKKASNMAGAPNTNELFITGGFSANIKKTIVYQNMKVGNFIENIQ